MCMISEPRNGSGLARLIAILFLVLIPLLGTMAVDVQAARVTAPCANTSTAPADANGTPVAPALPATGGGFGGTDCGRDPEACQDGGPQVVQSLSGQQDAIEIGPREAGLLAPFGPHQPMPWIMYALVGHHRLAVDTCGSSLPSAPSNANPPAAPVGTQATTPPPASSVASPPEPPTPVPCPPLPGPPPLPDARQIALGVAVPYPDVQIGVNPAPLGLTGLPSWFWIQGYDGRPLNAATTINVAPQIPAGYPGDCPPPPGATLEVTVQLTPFVYTWTFGDQFAMGTVTTTSLGKAYPQASDIQHRYETTSLGHPDGFPVTVTMRLHARYQANGAAWQDLPDASQTYTRAYQVQQAQTVVVNQR